MPHSLVSILPFPKPTKQQIITYHYRGKPQTLSLNRRRYTQRPSAGPLPCLVQRGPALRQILAAPLVEVHRALQIELGRDGNHAGSLLNGPQTRGLGRQRGQRVPVLVGVFGRGGPAECLRDQAAEEEAAVRDAGADHGDAGFEVGPVSERCHVNWKVD